MRLVWSEEFKSLDQWTCEEGLVRNQEAQYYTGRPSNISVGDGLVITACKENFKGAAYTSASIQSRPTWLYGRIEARLKLPHGSGVWPVFWTLGEDFLSRGWPMCGEIDIMEHIGVRPGETSGNVHYGTWENHRSSELWTKVTPGFHVHGIEWTEKKISFLVDGVVFHTFRIGKNSAFHRPHRLLLSLALGGTYGGVIDDTALPQQLVVSYVNVFRNP